MSAFSSPKKKILSASLLLLAALLTVIVVVKLTGDTLSAYISNGIVGAAASKGVDKTSILQRPWELLLNALHHIHTARKWLFVWTCAIVAVGAAVTRYWTKGTKYIVPIQLGIAAAGLIYSSHPLRRQLLGGTFADGLSIDLIVVAYLVALLVVVRYLTSTMAFGKREWDPQENSFLSRLPNWHPRLPQLAARIRTAFCI